MEFFFLKFKKIIAVGLFSLGFFLPFALAFAAPSARMVLMEDSAVFNIPPEVRKIVPEKDLVELVCYETKWRGGEAVTKVEFVNKGLEVLLAEVRRAGVEVKPSLFVVPSSIVDELKRKMDLVCSSKTLEESEKNLKQFISYADSLRDNIEIDLASKIRSEIEALLRAQAEKIRREIEEKIGREAQQEAKEVEGRLRAQAQREAEMSKKKIFERLQKQIEAQMIEEFKARMVEGGDNSALIAELKEKGRRMGEKLGAQEGEKIRKQIEEKYKKLAEEERKRLRKKYEEKAEQIAKSKREQLERIGKDFEEFGRRIKEQVAGVKTSSQWLEYKKRAMLKKRDIIARVVSHYIDLAKEKVKEYEPLIEKAYSSAKYGTYNIPRTIDLLHQLDNDKNQIVNELVQRGTDLKTIEEVQKKFQERWEKIRQTLEIVKFQAGADVYKELASKVNWDYVLSKLRKSFENIEKFKQAGAAAEAQCRKIHPSKRNWRQCARCNLLYLLQEKERVGTEVQAVIKEAMPLISQIKEKVKLQRADLVEALKFKDEVVEKMQRLRELQKEYGKIAERYERLYRVQQNICLSNRR